MKKVVFFGLLVMAVFLAVSCQNPINVSVEQSNSTTGSINGKVMYLGGQTNAGITVSLEKTDGLVTETVSQSVRAARAIERSIANVTQTGNGGAYTFAELSPGNYTIYASSKDSAEKAVTTNVIVSANRSVTANDLNLTATGSLSGIVNLDGSNTGNWGFFVSIAGTSYMAITDDSGAWKISDIPARTTAYQLIVLKGIYTALWDADGSTDVIAAVIGGSDKALGTMSFSGSVIRDGSSGLLWQGSLDAAPENPKVNWAYYDTTNKTSYIHDGTRWEILAISGQDGTNGTNGVTPELRINSGTNYWEVSVDNGSTWQSLGIKATGDKGDIGDTGAAGITPELRINSGTNYWEVSADKGSTWQSLGIKATGDKGSTGDTGAAGITPQLRINSGTNYWEVSSDKGSTWQSLGIKATGDKGDTGAAGITPQLRINSGTNYWEVSSDKGSTWQSLDIKATGDKGDTGAAGITPQLRINGETNYWEVSSDKGSTWQSLDVKATGDTGAAGVTPQLRINSGTNYWEVSADSGETWQSWGVKAAGNKGDTGVAPRLRINGETNYWEVSYDNEATWHSLYVKATGEKGDTGAAGVTPQLRINSVTNYWEVSADNGATWQSLGIKATGDKGATGVTPQLRINSGTNYWEVSSDNGSTWQSLGIKATGEKGAGIVWQGTSNSAPANPQLNWAYYNSTAGKAYIYNGSTWQIMSQNGTDGVVGIIWQDIAGVTPQLRINGSNYWEISTDDGSTWQSLGVLATGPQGPPGIAGNGDSMETASSLLGGIWTNGAQISPAGDVDWYKFTATSGNTYTLTWDDSSQGSGNYTGNVKVSAYRSDGITPLNSILDADNGYSSPKVISGYTGTVYIKVQGYNSSSTGTYLIKYEVSDNGSSMETATTLANGIWTNGAQISPEGDVDWYKFTATSDQTYILTWDDRGQGSGNATSDIKVSAYQSDGSTALNGILDVNHGYSSPKVISGYTGTVYIKVQANSYWNDPTGSYAIKYSTGDGNDSKETATTLTSGVLTSGTLISPEGDVDWYKFTANSSQTYILTWDDSGQGSENYTCDVNVSAYQSDGITALNSILNVDSGYSSPKIISGYTGTVYIKVQANNYWSDPTGSYAIKYSMGDSNDSMETATTLANGVWTNGAQISPTGDVDWYTFTASSSDTYSLTWDRYYHGSGNYTSEIRVSAYQSDGSTVLNGILNVDSGYSSPKDISGYTGKVYIKVEGSSGTYAIKYTRQ